MRELRILLVEDDDQTRYLFHRLLMLLGHQVQAVECVEAAKAIAAREQFDLVISDLGLPDGTGHQLMRYLKDHYGLKGIALSGYAMEDVVCKSMEAGFVEHISKPVDIDQLQAAILRTVNSARHKGRVSKFQK